MALSSALPDARRIRTYILRLPLATRLLILLLTGFYIAHLVSPGLEQWGALIPREIDLNNLYRLNTYPLIHRDVFHFLLNTVALVPLLERFEAEHGTVVTLILFTGPFGTLPGGLYAAVERFVLRANGAAVGASVWVFLLLAAEAIKTWRAHPHLAVLDVRVPTWITPLLGIAVVRFLVPHTSLLGHICGAAVGYLWGLGYIRFLAPHDRILRWVERKLNPLGRVPHYVSVDQKTYGRYGVLPSTHPPSSGGGSGGSGGGLSSPPNGALLGPIGSTQRLGP